MRVFFKLFFIIYALFLNETLAAQFKFTNVKCESLNQSWVTIEHCRLRAISRHKTILNIMANFHYAATKIHLRMQVLKQVNGYKPWLIDSTIDACAFLCKPNHPVAKIIYKWAKNSSSINHNCPYVGLQYIKDFYVTPEQMPLPCPTGDYALFLTWIFSGKPQFVTNVYATFVEDLIKQ